MYALRPARLLDGEVTGRCCASGLARSSARDPVVGPVGAHFQQRRVDRLPEGAACGKRNPIVLALEDIADQRQPIRASHLDVMVEHRRVEDHRVRSPVVQARERILGGVHRVEVDPPVGEVLRRRRTADGDHPLVDEIVHAADPARDLPDRQLRGQRRGKCRDEANPDHRSCRPCHLADRVARLTQLTHEAHPGCPEHPVPHPADVVLVLSFEEPHHVAGDQDHHHHARQVQPYRGGCQALQVRVPRLVGALRRDDL